MNGADLPPKLREIVVILLWLVFCAAMMALARESWMWTAKAAATITTETDLGLLAYAIPYVFAVIPVGILFLPIFLVRRAAAAVGLSHSRSFFICTGLLYVAFGIWANLA